MRCQARNPRYSARVDTNDYPRFGRYVLRIPALNLILSVIGLFFLGQVVLERTLNSWAGTAGFAGSEISGITCWALGSSSVRSLTAGEPWRLVASVFLHAGLLHFVVNAFSLWQLGRAVQVLFGGTRLLGIFLATGVAASLASDAWFAMRGSAAPSVGASGAVCGLMGLLLAHMRRRTDYAAQQFGRQLIGWAIVNAAIGLLIPEINNAAHAGGFIAGYALDWLIEGPHSRRSARFTVPVTGALAALCLAALLWAAVGAADRSQQLRDTMNALVKAEAALNEAAPLERLGALANELETATRGTTFARDGAKTADALRGDGSRREKFNALEALYRRASEDCGEPIPISETR
ncbi:MAG: rhomboid family intramembrane serine protease [Planctomycetes bacterium]|nr:rhomboid family intramembrane serine protease [Planctomycetota bacterium]